MEKYSDKITPGLLLAEQGKLLRPSKHGNTSLQMEFLIALLNTQISIFLLSNETSAAQVIPNPQTN
jgi:hypothetical protein